MTPLLFLAVAAAGGVGAAARFALDTGVQRMVPTSWPLGTAIVNVSGSFALGVVTGLALGGLLSSEWLALVGSGFLGGYTTFSTASLEVVRLLQKGRSATAVVLAFAVVVLGVAAAAAGLILGGAVAG